MSQTGYIILAIAIVVILLAIFVISFVAYVKTPAPEGCQKSYGPNCDTCEQESCKFYHYAELREAMKRKENEAKEATSASISERKEN